MKHVVASIFFISIILIKQPIYAGEKNNIILIKQPFDCSRSFCGCWADVEISYKTIIVSPDLTPQPNITVSCPQKGMLGVSDGSGSVAFTFKTSQSPGCGVICNMLTFSRDTASSYEAWNINIQSSKTDRTVLDQYYQKSEKKNNENDGLWQEWCLSSQFGSSGKLRISGNYKKGMKDGEWTEWYCEGSIKLKGIYRDGKKEGTWIEWYGDGQIHQQIDWHDDKMNGKWLSWHPNGQIEAEIEMRDDKRVGKSIYYTREGIKTVTDANGKIIQNPDIMTPK